MRGASLKTKAHQECLVGQEDHNCQTLKKERLQKLKSKGITEVITPT